MKAMDSRSGKDRKKAAYGSVENADLLFLNALCTYFEAEQILNKEQIERFRKNWLVQERKPHQAADQQI